MDKKLWGGRFEKDLDPDAVLLSYSLESDKRLVFADLSVNMAHVNALEKSGLLSTTEHQKLIDCLQGLEIEFRENPESLYGNDEDIHSCIERLVTERLGDTGKKLHTGKSRNDQVITDTRLVTKDAIIAIIGQLQQVIDVCVEKATEYQEVLFPGFTHFQPAQPVVLGHHFLAYAEKFFRDITRLENAYKTTDVCCLGSGAMAGNNYGLDREAIQKELGFSALSQNSMDAVSDRDFISETLAASSICMTHMSRFCEELIVFCSPIVGFFTLGDDFTTGSSIMPQKKNPDIAELIRGKTGRVQSLFTAMQTTLKGLPLTYNRDLQEDKLFLFESIETLLLCLQCFHKMMRTISIDQSAIQSALEKGYGVATDLADYCVNKGIPFRDAHELTGKIVLLAQEQNKQLHELTLEQFQQFSDKIESDIYDAITFEASVNAKNVVGGTAIEQVKKQCETMKGRMTWKKH